MTRPRRPATTASKAVASGVGANLVIVAIWLLTLIPGWTSIPDEPRGALIGLVAGGIGWALTYYTRTHVIDQDQE